MISHEHDAKYKRPLDEKQDFNYDNGYDGADDMRCILGGGKDDVPGR